MVEIQEIANIGRSSEENDFVQETSISSQILLGGVDVRNAPADQKEHANLEIALQDLNSRTTTIEDKSYCAEFPWDYRYRSTRPLKVIQWGIV